MYHRIVLAYDGSVEGRAALREGALLARRCGAEVFLLAVAGGAGVNMAAGEHAGCVANHEEQFRAIFDEGMARLKQLGFTPKGALVSGDAGEEIRNYAKVMGADLVIVGHRKRSLLERWWSGSSGAYLIDQIDCSLLIGRNNISDAAFQAELARGTAQPELAHA